MLFVVVMATDSLPFFLFICMDKLIQHKLTAAQHTRISISFAADYQFILTLLMLKCGLNSANV